MSPRHHGREFKREPAHLVVHRGVSLAQAARDLDLHPSLLWRWIRQFDECGDEAFPGQGKLTSRDEEVCHLRLGVAQLKAERGPIFENQSLFRFKYDCIINNIN